MNTRDDSDLPLSTSWGTDEVGVLMAKLAEARGMLLSIVAGLRAYDAGDPDPDMPTEEEIQRIIDRTGHNRSDQEP